MAELMRRSVRSVDEVGPLKNRALKVGDRKILAPEPKTLEMTPEMVASVVFDMACIAFGAKNQALALVLGVNESRISRWRNVHESDVPSTAQVIALGPEFERVYNKQHSMFRGFGRRALLDMVDALGLVAAAVE